MSWRLQLAAACGDKSSAFALQGKFKELRDGHVFFSEDLRAYGVQAMCQANLVLAHLYSDGVSLKYRERLKRAVRDVRTWLECPCPKHHAALDSQDLIGVLGSYDEGDEELELDDIDRRFVRRFLETFESGTTLDLASMLAWTWWTDPESNLRFAAEDALERLVIAVRRHLIAWILGQPSPILD